MKTIIQNIAKTVSFLFTFLFFINSNAQLNKILDFANTTNGSYPVGSLISDGTFLYGMTSAGGINNKGTIFKIMPDGTGYSKLLDFAGLSNGSSPLASLLLEGNIILMS